MKKMKESDGGWQLHTGVSDRDVSDAERCAALTLLWEDRQ